MAGNSRSPGRTVTDKVLSVLTAFESAPHALGLTEIAERADVPLSTAHRLVAELTEWGMLSRTANGSYQLGLRVWEMGQQVGARLRGTAAAYVHELHTQTGQTSHLAVRDGSEVLYIERLHGADKVPQASRVGGRLPLHWTAVGKALLAFEDTTVLEQYLTRPLTAVTPRTVTDPVRLRREIELVRERGYALTQDEARRGACSLAVPVFHRGRVGAALGVVVPSENASTLMRFLPALKAASRRLEVATTPIPLETLLQSQRSPLPSHTTSEKSL